MIGPFSGVHLKTSDYRKLLYFGCCGLCCCTTCRAMCAANPYCCYYYCCRRRRILLVTRAFVLTAWYHSYLLVGSIKLPASVSVWLFSEATQTGPSDYSSWFVAQAALTCRYNAQTVLITISLGSFLRLPVAHYLNFVITSSDTRNSRTNHNNINASAGGNNNTT